MRRRVFFGITILLLLLVAYGAAGTFVYSRATTVRPGCQPAWASDQPSAFATGGAFDIRDVDTTPYLMPDYETVTFTSREDGLHLMAWYVPADAPDAPAVILTHGLNACRHSPEVLLPAGMLHRAGFTTLLIDLRNHGESQVSTGRMSGGILEYRDVLGAWDWLVNEKHIPPERIGLFGVSLGAATSLIAAGEEPRVAAVWADSSFSDIPKAINGELTRQGLPTFLASAGESMGQVIDGVDITARSPLEAVAKLDGRPVFITHSRGDTRMPEAHAEGLIAALDGQNVDSWIVDDSEHIQAMFDHLDEYETRLVNFFETRLNN